MSPYVDNRIEKYDLYDVTALRDTGMVPLRFRLPASISKFWPEHLAGGSAIIVDLGAADAIVQQSLVAIMRAIHSAGLGLRPLLWEHGRHSTCADGLLSTGYIQAILHRAHLREDGSANFGNLSILDTFPYCTPLFAHKVHDARVLHALDTPLLALEKALELNELAASKNCELLGIVELAHAVQLLDATRSHAAGTSRSHAAGTSAAIVRCADAHGNPHHVTVVWTRTRGDDHLRH